MAAGCMNGGMKALGLIPGGGGRRPNGSWGLRLRGGRVLESTMMMILSLESLVTLVTWHCVTAGESWRARPISPSVDLQLITAAPSVTGREILTLEPSCVGPWWRSSGGQSTGQSTSWDWGGPCHCWSQLSTASLVSAPLLRPRERGA